MAVRPEGKRRINRPSDVIPVTRLRTERVRPRVESAAELRLEGARLAAEATDFFVLSAADWLAVVGGVSVFACGVGRRCRSILRCIRWSGAVQLSVGYLSLLNIGWRNVKRIRSRRGVCRSRSFSWDSWIHGLR